MTPIESPGPGRLLGIVSGAVGAVVLVGWVFDLPDLRTPLPDTPGMKANAAIGLILAGAALALLDGSATPARLAAGRLAAAIVAVLGLATLGEYLFGWQLGIDELLFRDTVDAFTWQAGRMAPYTAFAFAFAGSALLALTSPRRRHHVPWLAWPVALVGAAGLFGYAWNATRLLTDAFLPPVALHTAAALLLLGIGILLAARRIAAPSTVAPATRSSIELRVGKALLGALVLLAAGSGLTYRAVARIGEAGQSVLQTHETLERLSRIDAALGRAESAQRMQLLTGSAPESALEIEPLAREVHADIVALLGLAENDAERETVRHLDDAVTRRLDALAAVLALDTRAGTGVAQRRTALERSSRLMVAVRTQIAAMQDHERADLRREQRQAERQQRHLFVVLLMLLLGATVGFGVLLRNVRREMLARAAADAQVRRSHAELEQRVEERTAALRENRQRFIDLFEFAPDALVTADGEGRIVHVNRRAETLFGWSRDGLAGRGIDVLVPAVSRARLATLLVDTVGGAVPRQHALQALRKDGSAFPADLTLGPLKDSDGSMVVASVRDVSEREHAVEALRQSSVRYREILDHMLEGCQVIGFDWVYRFVNAEAARQSRSTPEAMVGRTMQETFPGIEDTEVFALMRRCMDERTVGHTEIEFFFADGSRGWFAVAVLPAPEGIVVLSTDISAQRRAQAQSQADLADLERRVAERTAELEQAREAADAASRAKSAFLAAMSHEIRTPMNGVVGMIDVLAHTRLTPDQADAVETIRGSAFSLLGLIDDILDYSKIEAGRLDLERAPVALPELIESVCASLLPVANEREVGLRLFIDPALPASVWSDATRLRQVLFNLLGNAVKFSSGPDQRHGRVSLRAEPAPGSPARVVVSVADSGIGMSSETVQRLFTSFTQAEASTTRRYGGTGLGLAICKRLVDLMGGDIAVQSTLGEGSTFTVTLPLQPVADAPERPTTLLDGVQCIVSGTALPPEDLRRYLEHAGARVQLAADAGAAVRLAADIERPVVIHNGQRDARDPRPALAAFAGAADARHVLIVTGRRRNTPASDELIAVDGNGLRRSALLRAVAAAAGRVSPETEARDSQTADEPVFDDVAAPSVAEARGMGRLILVAEDDPINRKVILRQLAMLGHAAEVSENGADALQMWRRGGYALLLTDLHMPEMDGYALAGAIRRDEAARGVQPSGRLPILALTANALRGERLRAQAAGVDEYLTKPIPIGQLKAALAQWLPFDRGESVLGELPSVPAPRPAFDVSVLASIVGDDPAVVRDFLTEFRAAARQALADLQAADPMHDASRIGGIAHKLKSSSRSVGTLALGDDCAELENACLAGERDGVVRQLARVTAAITQAERGIADYLRAA